MKVVINAGYGGFCLSEEAYKFLGIEWDGYGHRDSLKRDYVNLVKCVETLGDDANGMCAKLKVVEIPDDIEWVITEYDGWEIVEEVHRSWG